MGRPIQGKWFGLPSLSGAQITVNGVKFADGTTATTAYIVKQTGSTAYLVQDTAQTHAAERVFMVNATSLAGLAPGQCFITATPFGGTPLPCAKISQFRVSLYDVDGTIDNYSWSTQPASAYGQANLVAINGGAGQVLSVSLLTGGYGYFTAPGVTFTGGGSGAGATTIVANGVVTSITLNTYGSGYANGNITIAAAPAAVKATANVTVSGGKVTAVTPVLGGGYYATVPVAVISGNGTGASATPVLTNGVVTGFTNIVQGTGYTSATIDIAIAPAAVQATGSAVVDL